MSYPRNAAAPEPIAIGAVIQISDGAVQTAGVNVRVKPTGVAEGDGGGSVDYSTDGVVMYTPLQAETDYSSFILIASKTGCIPVGITVLTADGAADALSLQIDAIPGAILGYDWEDFVGDPPDRSMLNALRHIRNRWIIVGLTKSVMKEDDVTVAFTTTITADSNGNITSDTPD